MIEGTDADSFASGRRGGDNLRRGRIRTTRCPDDVALQTCLDNYDWVLLQPPEHPGYVGYVISHTVKLKHDHILLTTADNPRKLTFVASPDLTEPLLRASSANDYEISFIRFDGNREDRAVRNRPCDNAHDFHNVELAGSRFHVRYVDSLRATCGSGMVVGGAKRLRDRQQPVLAFRMGHCRQLADERRDGGDCTRRLSHRVGQQWPARRNAVGTRD